MPTRAWDAEPCKEKSGRWYRPVCEIFTTYRPVCLKWYFHLKILAKFAERPLCVLNRVVFWYCSDGQIHIIVLLWRIPYLIHSIWRGTFPVYPHLAFDNTLAVNLFCFVFFCIWIVFFVFYSSCGSRAAPPQIAVLMFAWEVPPFPLLPYFALLQ